MNKGHYQCWSRNLGVDGIKLKVDQYTYIPTNSKNFLYLYALKESDACDFSHYYRDLRSNIQDNMKFFQNIREAYNEALQSVGSEKSSISRSSENNEVTDQDMWEAQKQKKKISPKAVPSNSNKSPSTSTSFKVLSNLEGNSNVFDKEIEPRGN